MHTAFAPSSVLFAAARLLSVCCGYLWFCAKTFSLNYFFRYLFVYSPSFATFIQYYFNYYQCPSPPFPLFCLLLLVGRNNYNGKCVQTRINGQWSSVLKCCHSIIKGRSLSSNYSTFSSLLPSFPPYFLPSFKIRFLFAIFFDLFFLGKGLLASLRLKGYQYCSINVNNNLSVYILLC